MDDNSQVIHTLRRLRRRVKSLVRSLQREEQAIRECQTHEQVFHCAQLLEANIYRIQPRQNTILVEDWTLDGKKIELVIDPKLSPADNVKRLYKRAKKLKLGLHHHERQSQGLNDELKIAREFIEAIEHPEDEENQLKAIERASDSLGEKNPQNRSHHPQKKSPFKTYYTESGDVIWVGKGAAQNDRLTFVHAHGNDYWFHAADCSGAHVVLRSQSGESPDPESLRDAQVLALLHSKNAGEQQRGGRVVYTQCKYLRRVKGKLGAVTMAKSREVDVAFDEKRLNRLRGVLGE